MSIANPIADGENVSGTNSRNREDIILTICCLMETFGMLWVTINTTLEYKDVPYFVMKGFINKGQGKT